MRVLHTQFFQRAGFADVNWIAPQGLRQSVLRRKVVVFPFHGDDDGRLFRDPTSRRLVTWSDQKDAGLTERLKVSPNDLINGRRELHGNLLSEREFPR